MAAPRPDITDRLVHYIRGDTFEQAFEVLGAILNERRLRCGTGYIRGEYCCVCFSEAPFTYLGYAIARGYQAKRPYQPFGILVEKDWLFAQGGRPVIYQPDSEYTQLPDELRWRHVRYDPVTTAPVDFTWEREWRVRIDELPISPEMAEVVLPSRQFLHQLYQEHDAHEDQREEEHRRILNELAAWQLRAEFPWRVHVLDSDGSVA